MLLHMVTIVKPAVYVCFFVSLVLTPVKKKKTFLKDFQSHLKKKLDYPVKPTTNGNAIEILQNV